MKISPYVGSASIWLLCASLSAQVPDGACIVSTFAPGFGSPSSGGVFLVDPYVPGMATAVTGLPSELTDPPGFAPGGASCVRVRPDDGVVLVGEAASAGAAIELREFELAGAAVSSEVAHPLGTVDAAAFQGGVVDLEIIPGSDGDALVTVTSLAVGPPLMGASFAIVSRAGSVQPVTVSGFSGFVSAVTTDASGTNAYAVVFGFGPGTEIYTFPLPGGGPATLLAQIPQQIGSVARRADGDLLATDVITSDLLRIDSTTGAVTSLPQAGPPIVRGQIERVTGRVLYSRDGASGPDIGWIDAGGTQVSLSSSGMSGVVSGFDVFDNPRSFGCSSPGAADYRWQGELLPGGAPRVGNASFALQLTSTGASATGCLFASPDRGATSVLGIDVLLDTGSWFWCGDIAASGLMPLPIPNTVPVGWGLNFQTFHLDSGAPLGIAASDGLRVTVMP